MTMDALVYSGRGYLGFSIFTFIVLFQQNGLPYATFISVFSFIAIYGLTYLALYVNKKIGLPFSYNNYLATIWIIAGLLSIIVAKTIIFFLVFLVSAFLMKFINTNNKTFNNFIVFFAPVTVLTLTILTFILL